MYRTFIIVLLLFITSISLLQAQEKDSIDYYLDLSLEELMQIEVTGLSRYKQDVSDIPNSIQVISQKQIKERGYHDLSDVLKDMPDFDITGNVGRLGELYAIRGIEGNDRLLVLINGHKLNPATGTYLSIGKSIAIANAERIEIIYGPVSAMYGADAFSGIINIIFKKENNENENNFQGNAYINYGSMNTKDFALNLYQKISEDYSMRLDFRMYNSDGFDILGRDTIYDIIKTYQNPIANKCEQAIKDHSVFMNLNYKDWSLNYYRQQFDEGNALAHNPSIYIYDKSNKWKTTTDIIWANYTTDLDNDITLNMDISYKRHIQDENTIFHKWEIPNQIGDTYQQFMTGKDHTIHGVFTFHQYYSDKLDFIVGIDNEYNISIPPYANDEVLGSADKYEGENKTKIDDELTLTENRFATFGQFTYNFSDFISIILGGRYDYSTRYNSVFNPRTALMLKPFEDTKINLTYGRAFQAPSLFFLYEQFGTPTITMISATEIEKQNPSLALKNQIVNSYELNVSQKISSKINARITFYFNDLTDLIERNLFTDSVYNKYFDKYTSGLRNENIGSQKVLGGNIFLNSQITKKINVSAYFSYTDAKYKVKNKKEYAFPRISKEKIWLSITASNLFEYFTITPRLKWINKMYNLNNKVFADNYQDAYVNVDLSLSINNLSKHFRIYANFQNLLNRDIEHGGFSTQTGIYTAVIPQDKFTCQIGIEANF